MKEQERIIDEIVEKMHTINVMLDFDGRTNRIGVFENNGKYKIKKLYKNSSQTLFESYNPREINVYLKGYCNAL